MIEEHKVHFEKDGFIISGITYIILGDSNLGFNCGISVFIPDDCQNNTTLLMHSCDTSSKGLNPGNSAYHLDETNLVAEKSTYETPNPGMWYGYDLKYLL